MTHIKSPQTIERFLAITELTELADGNLQVSTRETRNDKQTISVSAVLKK